MLHEIFVVIPRHDSSDSYKSLLNSLYSHFELSSEQTYLEEDFCYAFAKLKTPLTHEQAFSIRNDFQDKLDVLFSEVFPDFSAQDGLTGAVVLDMDMTSVQIEGIDEIARRVGVFDEVAAITHEAMQGNLDFRAALRRRVALLKGGDAKAILSEIRSILPETPGFAALMAQARKLKQRTNAKFYTCIASGGFKEIIQVLVERYGLDFVVANSLLVDATGHFSGEVVGDAAAGGIVDAHTKAELVVRLIKEYGVNKANTIVLGDGANDLVMMREGNLGIAYHAKSKVQEVQLNVLNHGTLAAVAKLMSIRS